MADEEIEMRMPSVVAIVSFVVVATSCASAQSPDYLGQNRAVFRAYSRQHPSNGVISNGRCRGQSYGTGARSCGTATGGPVGGISGRN